jgi:hypothetical protein
VSGWFEVSDQTKVIRGTDRSVDHPRLQIVAMKVEQSAKATRPPVEKSA